MATRMKMGTTKVELPPELILEIFLCLQTKSLIRLSPVLDDHPVLAGELQTSSFRRKHTLKVMSQSENQQLMIPFKNSGSIIIQDFDPWKALPTESTSQTYGFEPIISQTYEFEQVFKDVLPYATEKFKSYEVIGVCNGLVCLLFEFSSYHIIVWNPFTGEYHALPKPRKFVVTLESDYYFLHKDRRFPVCGFGYDVVNETYKVVMAQGSVTKFYDLSTNVWKKVNKININWDDDFEYLKMLGRPSVALFGNYVNGSLRWMVSKTSIVSIDLSTMVSTHINLVPSSSSDPSEHESRMGSVSQGWLLAAHVDTLASPKPEDYHHTKR